MAKVVLDVPKEFMGLVDTWRQTLDSMKARPDRIGGGKAVDYAQGYHLGRPQPLDEVCYNGIDHAGSGG